MNYCQSQQFLLFQTVAIELIVQHIRDFLNNRTRPDTDGAYGSSFFFDATKGKQSDVNDSQYTHSTHYRPH